MWESWDYAYYYNDYEDNGWSWEVDKGYETKIYVRGEDANFSFSNTLGEDMSPAKRRNVKVYGAIPSNHFNPANVEIDNFVFDVPEEEYYYNFYG